MKKISYLLLVLLIFASCGPQKDLAEGELKRKTSRTVINSLEDHNPDFETINGRMKAQYDDGEKSQSISITYRIQKDEAIWMSAKFAGLITVAKIYITPKEVQFYEKINGEYFQGDFSLVSQFLGVEMNFEKLQNLLFGQRLFDWPLRNTQATFEEGNYVFTSKITDQFQQEAFIEGQKFTLSKQRFSSLNSSKEVDVNYSDYTKINKKLFPKEIDILAQQENRFVKLNLEYRTIKIDEELSFPFSIPNGYKEMKL
ncbi:MAG: DUF4292 domain-containing protein [Bacteroidota bacterium]